MGTVMDGTAQAAGRPVQGSVAATSGRSVATMENANDNIPLKIRAAEYSRRALRLKRVSSKLLMVALRLSVKIEREKNELQRSQ